MLWWPWENKFTRCNKQWTRNLRSANLRLLIFCTTLRVALKLFSPQWLTRVLIVFAQTAAVLDILTTATCPKFSLNTAPLSPMRATIQWWRNRILVTLSTHSKKFRAEKRLKVFSLTWMILRSWSPVLVKLNQPPSSRILTISTRRLQFGRLNTLRT